MLAKNMGESQIEQGSLRLECRSDTVLINLMGSSRAKTVGERSPMLGRNSRLRPHWTRALAGDYSGRLGLGLKLEMDPKDAVAGGPSVTTLFTREWLCPSRPA